MINNFLNQLIENRRRDYHVHTKYCNHASGEMRDYVESALAKGFEEIGFLAHVEVGVDHKLKRWLNGSELEIYWRQGNELRKEFEDRIIVSLGLEVGLNPKRLDLLDDAIGLHPWDRIGLSHHFIEWRGEPVNIASTREAQSLRDVDPLEIIIPYYQGLCDHMADFRPFMICHFDLVRKFLADIGPHPLVRPLVRSLLEQMVEHGVRLEINTSGYNQTGTPYPADWILREASSLQVNPVLCSDSHHPDHIGREFDQAIRDVTRILET